MKRFVTFALVSALVLGASSIAYANICAFDAVPAATILFPFVTLDYNNPATGLSTTFSITNVSSEAQIVHVTVWTDWSASLLDFNILLTGYDVISMNIRDILIDGQLPVTTWAGHSGAEGVSPHGPVSPSNQANPALWLDGLLADPEATNALGDRCNTSDPTYPGRYTTKIDPSFLGLFQSFLQISQTVDRWHSNDCVKPYADTAYTLAPEPYWVTRDTSYPTNMYITADVVERCNKVFPDALGYWAPGANQIPRYDNVLIGDVFWTSLADRFSEASAAVHLEASLNLPVVNTPAPVSPFGVSFYHRYAWLNDSYSDFREPLPSAWAFRYLGAGVPDIGTDVRVFKGSSLFDWTYDLERVFPDPTALLPDALVASNCHAYTYYAWDEEEMVTQVSQIPWSGPSGDVVIPNLIPLETQQIPVDQFDTPGAFGWMLFVWPPSNYPMSDAFDDVYQTWMGVRYNAAGQWSAAMDAAVMANFSCFPDQVLPNLGINYQYVDINGYYNPNMMPVN